MKIEVCHNMKAVKLTAESMQDAHVLGDLHSVLVDGYEGMKTQWYRNDEGERNEISYTIQHDWSQCPATVKESGAKA